MAKRKTEKDYYILAEFRGFKWLGGELPKNVTTSTIWKCGKEHIFKSRYNDIQQGQGCPYCSGKAKKTKNNYYKLAKNYNFVWLEKKLPKNVHTNTFWGCPVGHVFKTTYNNFIKFPSCPVCSNHIKKTEDDYYILAKSCGFKWVGRGLPKTTSIPTMWKCKMGHTWLSRYQDIRKGNKCPYCSGRVKKIDKDYHDLANSRNFVWLSLSLPKNTNIGTVWGCSEGHRFTATYSSIKQGSGCSYCSKNVRKNEIDYAWLAAAHGLVWLGYECPKNVSIKTLWSCSACHTFESSYNYVQRGAGCPKCKDTINGSPVSKPQRKLNKLLYGSLNYPEDRYRIDVAIMRNSQKVAVEYDAQYWHQGREEHDERRDRFLISHGWKILHVKSGKLLPTRKQLKKKINKLLKNNINVVDLYLEDWKKEEGK